MTHNLVELLNKEINAKLTSEFGYKSPMQVPRIEKIVVNMGVGDAVHNSANIETAVAELEQITGQKPLITKAKKSIASFKLREDLPIGAKVTLRSNRMYDFFEKLTKIVLPRVRDFKGTPKTSFDGRGNYTLGIKEQTIFPEINFDKVKKVRGMDIVIVTTAKTDKEAKALLTLLGMPFAK